MTHAIEKQTDRQTDSRSVSEAEDTVLQSVSQSISQSSPAAMMDDELGELKLKYEDSQKNLQLLKRLAEAGSKAACVCVCLTVL